MLDQIQKLIQDQIEEKQILNQIKDLTVINEKRLNIFV